MEKATVTLESTIKQALTLRHEPQTTVLETQRVATASRLARRVPLSQPNEVGRVLILQAVLRQ